MTPAVSAKTPKDWHIPTPGTLWWKAPDLASSLKACRIVTKHHAKSFYFASFPLPKYKRYGAFVVYAYCRYIDDIIDEAEDAELAPTEDFLRRELDEILAGKDGQDFAPALREVVKKFGIPKQLWHDLIHGCCLDRGPQLIKDYEELELYCYYVASVVGLIMCCVFGIKDARALPHALEMGIALQLTNIMRDVDEDWKKGRCYIPHSILSEFELCYEDLDKRSHDERWARLSSYMIEKAWSFYEKGSRGLQAIPEDGSQQCARIMARVYAGILDRISARDGNLFQGRAYVPITQKIALAYRALRKQEAFRQ